jgi:hypothetical protein
LCGVETDPGEAAEMVFPVLLATIFVLDLAATRRNSARDANLSRVVLTGWLTPAAMVAIAIACSIAASVARAACGSPPVEQVMIAEMELARSWVERLTPSVMMLWVAAVAVAAFVSARCPRAHVTSVQLSATLLGFLVLQVW